MTVQAGLNETRSVIYNAEGVKWRYILPKGKTLSTERVQEIKEIFGKKMTALCSSLAIEGSYLFTATVQEGGLGVVEGSCKVVPNALISEESLKSLEDQMASEVFSRIKEQSPSSKNLKFLEPQRVFEYTW